MSDHAIHIIMKGVSFEMNFFGANVALRRKSNEIIHKV